MHAIDALGKIGPAATPALIAALKDPHEAVRGNAAVALAEIGPNAAETVPALAAALKDPVENVRQSAANALGKIGAAV
jgi:HEAT repeat protein